MKKKEFHPLIVEQYTQLENHCKNCPNYHVQNFEKFDNPVRTYHRCKALSTDHRDEYSRGYYQGISVGSICPITGKSITSKTIMQTMHEVRFTEALTKANITECPYCKTKIQK